MLKTALKSVKVQPDVRQNVFRVNVTAESFLHNADSRAAYIVML